MMEGKTQQAFIGSWWFIIAIFLLILCFMDN